MALHFPRWATREREKQFALFSDVVIHRYKFSNRPFCISSSRDQLSVKTKTVRVCTIGERELKEHIKIR